MWLFMPKMKTAKFGGMGRKASHSIKSSNKKRTLPKGSTKKTRILKHGIKKAAKAIADYNAPIENRLKAGIYLIRTLGNISAMPHIKKMMINDPAKEIRKKASDFFFQVATKKNTKTQTINSVLEILKEAVKKEKDNFTRLYIKSHVVVIEDIQKRHKWNIY